MERSCVTDSGPLPVETKVGSLARLLDARNASGVLGICERTLFDLQKSGAVRSVKIGKRRLYDPNDLAQFIDRQKTPDPTTIAV